ncbi:MAG: DUF1499 domain-containing protein [Candidatus Eiseniibacteriota bacterium]|jgi:uncharacterized protein (DUF1499 family)
MGILVLVIVALPVLIMVWARSAPRPDHLGVANGHLAPCPSSPNCVTSGAAADSSHRMEPWQYEGPAAVARERLLAIIRATRGTRVIETDGSYIAAEFRTPVFGFVDDVEFLIDGDRRQIHFRSASRLGYSDLGVNRRRMERLGDRFRLEQGGQSSTVGPGAARSRP